MRKLPRRLLVPAFAQRMATILALPRYTQKEKLIGKSSVGQKGYAVFLPPPILKYSRIIYVDIGCQKNKNQLKLGNI